MTTGDFATWSPDGGSLVFAQRPADIDHEFEMDIWTVGLSDGARRQIANDQSGWAQQAPKWSPDGSTIFYQMDYEFSPEILSVPGMAPPTGLPAGETGEVWAGTELGGRDITDYDWSPDGSRLIVTAYPRGVEQPVPNVYTVRHDASDAVAITHTSAVIERRSR